MGELFPRAMIESVRPEYVYEFLEPYRDYCMSRGLAVDLESWKSDERGFVERVYRFLNEMDAARPRGLVAASDAIVHVADDDGHDHVHAALAEHGAMPSLPPLLTRTELALWAYERFPDAFADAARRKQRVSKQSLWEFLPADRRPLLGATSTERQAALNERLAARHGKLGHTRYARIDVVETPFETKIFWLHGRTAQTQGIIQPDEAQRTMQRVVRDRCDTTVIDRLTGTVAITALNPAQVGFLRETLGDVFFGNIEHYKETSIFTGAPLLERGQRALSVEGLPALERVEVRALTLWWDESGREHYMSDSCVFDTHVRRMREAQRTPETVVLGMRLALRYPGDPRERTVQISMPNHITVDRRVAARSLRTFLVTRGFANYGEGNDWRLAA